jgi:hypothetical protein
MLIELEKYDDYSERNFRIKMYNKNGWSDAKKDVDPSIRMKYYKQHGYSKDALKDSHHAIRFNAYQKLGWTKEALLDPCSYIKNYALIDKNLW